MKHCGYLLLLLFVCMSLVANAKPCSQQKPTALFSLQRSVVKNTLPVRSGGTEIACDGIISAGACNHVQPVYRPIICPGNRINTLHTTIASAAVLFSSPTVSGNNQLKHNYPFHNFW